MKIDEAIMFAVFGDKFVTRGGVMALFLRHKENAEYKFADFYVEDWGVVQVFRKDGRECHGNNQFDIIQTFEDYIVNHPLSHSIPNETKCPECGEELRFIDGMRIWFCDRCKSKYVYEYVKTEKCSLKNMVIRKSTDADIYEVHNPENRR